MANVLQAESEFGRKEHDSFNRLNRLLKLTTLLIDPTELIMDSSEIWIHLNRSPEMISCLYQFAFLKRNCSQSGIGRGIFGVDTSVRLYDLTGWLIFPLFKPSSAISPAGEGQLYG